MQKLTERGRRGYGLSLSRASWVHKGYIIEGLSDGYRIVRPDGRPWKLTDTRQLAVALIDSETD
jgi:hypothetical protein